jgi:hypothetical protein
VRTCAFCFTRQPLSALGQVADSLQCLDVQACTQRAQASGVYPVAESEQEISRFEVMQGALR